MLSNVRSVSVHLSLVVKKIMWSSFLTYLFYHHDLVTCTWCCEFTGLPLSSFTSEWVSEWVKPLSRVRLFATPWTIAYQGPSSTGFSRQEYWSGLPFPSPGDLPNPGIKPRCPTFQADALTSELPGNSPVLLTNLQTIASFNAVYPSPDQYNLFILWKLL